MMKATTRYSENPLIINYAKMDGGYDKAKVLTVRRKPSYMTVGGQHISTTPKCDGDELCGRDATHMITMLQYHDVYCNQATASTIAGFRNFMLLCPECLDLYKTIDVMIGEPVKLKENAE
jgi:hypothetical protein